MSCLAAGLLAGGLAAPAAAQNILQSFFGELRQAIERPAPAVEARAFAEPFTEILRSSAGPAPAHGEGGPARAFCVRTCDGHYFAVHAQPGMSAAQACNAFCPGSETRLYSGTNIDYAIASDGSRYASLHNAYLYRKHLVAGCTCNGHDPFGLAHIDVNTDSTLKPGDVVATAGGLVVFSGDKNSEANFTPVQSYPRFSKSFRNQLLGIRVARPPANASAATTSSLFPTAGKQYSAQLEK